MPSLGAVSHVHPAPCLSAIGNCPLLSLRRLRALNEKQGLFTPHVCTPDELLGD